MKTQSRIAQIQCLTNPPKYVMPQFTFDIFQAFIPQTYKTIDSNHNSLQLAFLLDGQAYIMSNRKFRYLFSANSFSSSGGKNIFIGTSQLIQIFISQKLLHFFAISISSRGARIYHLRLFSYFRYLFLRTFYISLQFPFLLSGQKYTNSITMSIGALKEFLLGKFKYLFSTNFFSPRGKNIV